MAGEPISGLGAQGINRQPPTAVRVSVSNGRAKGVPGTRYSEICRLKISSKVTHLLFLGMNSHVGQ